MNGTSIKICHVCGSYNQPAAGFCQNCGTDISRNPAQVLPPPQRNNSGGCLKWLMIFLAVCFGIFSLFAVTHKRSPSETRSEYHYGVTNTDAFVATGMFAVGHLSRAAKNKDYDYLRKLQDQGEVFLIKKGTNVKFNESHKLDGFVYVIIESGYHAGESGYTPRSSID